MKNIVVLGCTGSIGKQTLSVVENLPGKFNVVALAAKGSRAELLIDQITRFKPRYVVVYDETALVKIREDARIQKLDYAIEFSSGMQGLMELSALPEADIVVNALVGMIGIQPTIATIKSGKRLALANKETLVCAGELIMKLVDEYQATMIPIDSEHGAIFQCIQGINMADLHSVILTASGGPFRGKKREDLLDVTPAQAVKHPNWNMGVKISIDSATLVNKGLEMIELKWLYHLNAEQIIPIIHPQSIIHSMIELKDGSVLAQLSEVDMRLPIEVALLFPERGERIIKPLSFLERSKFTFEPIDEDVFKSVPLARQTIVEGGLLPAVYNAANEVAVAAFLDHKISFLQIYDCIEYAMEKAYQSGHNKSGYQVEDIDRVSADVTKWIGERFL